MLGIVDKAVMMVRVDKGYDEGYSVVETSQ